MATKQAFQSTTSHEYSRLEACHPAWTCALRGFCVEYPEEVAQIDKNVIFCYFESTAPRYGSPSRGSFIGVLT